MDVMKVGFFYPMGKDLYDGQNVTPGTIKTDNNKTVFKENV